MRNALATLIAFALCVAGQSAEAASALDRAKMRGTVQCGAYSRPGLAALDSKTGAWHGLEVDVCRAVAAAVLDKADAISFRDYETAADVRSLAGGADDVSFLTESEIAANDLSGRIVPGPAIFIESHALMIPAASKERHVADLPGERGVCFMSGSPLERSLPAFFGAIGKSWRPVPFTEDAEMIDAYNVQRCHAIAYEVTTLAVVREERGVNNLKGRILPEPIATYPVIAVTGTSDGEWSAIVAWTVYTVIAADRPSTKWTVGSVNSIPAPLTELGLAKGWQARVVSLVGTYQDVFDRNLGARSPLGLPRGLNSDQVHGGALLSPIRE